MFLELNLVSKFHIPYKVRTPHMHRIHNGKLHPHSKNILGVPAYLNSYAGSVGPWTKLKDLLPISHYLAANWASYDHLPRSFGLKVKNPIFGEEEGGTLHLRWWVVRLTESSRKSVIPQSLPNSCHLEQKSPNWHFYLGWVNFDWLWERKSGTGNDKNLKAPSNLLSFMFVEEMSASRGLLVSKLTNPKFPVISCFLFTFSPDKTIKPKNKVPYYVLHVRK